MAGKRKAASPIRRLAPYAAAAAVALVVAVLAGMELTAARREAAETAQAWTVAGEACPVPAPNAAPARPTISTVYEGTTFSREVSRGVNCNVISPEGSRPVPVCMFIGPGALRVETEGGVYDFAPPPGEPATVYVRESGPECVMAVNRTLF